MELLVKCFVSSDGHDALNALTWPSARGRASAEIRGEEHPVPKPGDGNHAASTWHDRSERSFTICYRIMRSVSVWSGWLQRRLCPFGRAAYH